MTITQPQLLSALSPLRKEAREMARRSRAAWRLTLAVWLLFCSAILSYCYAHRPANRRAQPTAPATVQTARPIPHSQLFYKLKGHQQ